MSELLIKIQEEVEGLGIDCWVDHLCNYPKEDKYIQINCCNLPFILEKGLDTFYYSGLLSESKRNLWYVSRNDKSAEPLYIEKGFRCYKKALKEALHKYKKELQSELDIIESIKI